MRINAAAAAYLKLILVSRRLIGHFSGKYFERAYFGGNELQAVGGGGSVRISPFSERGWVADQPQQSERSSREMFSNA
jgi:hypothetical protein